MRSITIAATLVVALALTGCGDAPADVTLDDAGARSGAGSGTDASAEGAPQPGEGSQDPGDEHAAPGDGTSPSRPSPGPPGTAAARPSPTASPGGPDETVSHEVVTPSPPPSPEPGAGMTTPRPGTDDPTPRQWESAEPRGDGRSVVVTWWSGVEPCNVLDRVDVREEPDRVVITIWEGSEPGFDGACTMQAVQKRTQVRLAEPVGDRELVDGAAR